MSDATSSRSSPKAVTESGRGHIRQTLVHEADVAAVAAAVLTSEGHDGKASTP